MHCSNRVILSAVVATLGLGALSVYSCCAVRSPSFLADLERNAARPRLGADPVLAARLDGLARQIREIDANIANLGTGNAAALRFRTVSLAAYQRAWAELTRDQVDFGAGSEAIAALPGRGPDRRR